MDKKTDKRVPKPDREIEALAVVNAVLLKLDADAAQRVLYYLCGRHGRPGFFFEVQPPTQPFSDDPLFPEPGVN